MLKINNGHLEYDKEYVRDKSLSRPSFKHEDLIQEIKGYNLYSAILLEDFLDEDLMKNPEYTDKSYFVGPSPIHRDLGFKNFESHLEVPFDARIPPLPEDIDKETAHKFKNAVIDGKIILHQYEHIRNELEAIRGGARSKRLKERTERLYELCTPTIGTKYKRRYNAHEDLCWHFDRNRQVQYFFVENGGVINLVCGAGSGSYLREMHGLYAHAFALLDAVKPIKTEVFKLNSRSEWVLLQSFDSLKVTGYDLTGNYQPETKVDFTGKVVYPRQKNYSYLGVEDADRRGAYFSDTVN